MQSNISKRDNSSVAKVPLKIANKFSLTQGNEIEVTNNKLEYFLLQRQTLY